MLSVEVTVIYTVVTNIPVNGFMCLSPGGTELMPPPPEEESLSGDPNQDHVLNMDGDEFTYCGMSIGRCFYCDKQVDAEEVMTKRMDENWMVPSCEGCWNEDNRPCPSCHEIPFHCQQMEDARSY